MNTPFKFDPLKFGFRPLSDFPELIQGGLKDWIGKGEVFIKITNVGDKATFGRKVFWYHICKYAFPTMDDRVRFYSHSFSADDNCAVTSTNYPQEVYMGTVASEEFATLLLCNLLGTGQNKDVLTYGKQRTEQDLYPELRSVWP